MLGLRDCVWLSLVEGSAGYSLEVVLGFSLQWSSRVVEQELQGVHSGRTSKGQPRGEGLSMVTEWDRD